MSRHNRIRFESAGLHGVRYGLAVGAAVLFQLGLFLIWFSAVWRFKTAPRTFVPMSTAFPELYYFGIVVGIAGGFALGTFLVIATFRWLRGVQYTLAELIALVLVASAIVFCCSTQGLLDQASYATALLYPLLYKFFPSAVSNFSWQGSPEFNMAVNLMHLAVLAAFGLGLWARIPPRLKGVKFGTLAATFLLWFACGKYLLFFVAPALAVPALLICGLATRDPFTEARKLAASLTQPIFPRRTKVPPAPGPLVQNP